MTTCQIYNHFTLINTEELDLPCHQRSITLNPWVLTNPSTFSCLRSRRNGTARWNIKDSILFLEAAESVQGSRPSYNSNQNSDKKSGKKKSSSKKARDDDDSGGKLYCLVHGECGHNSNNCSVLQKEAKQLQKDYTAKKSGGKSNTWSCKSEEAKTLL